MMFSHQFVFLFAMGRLIIVTPSHHLAYRSALSQVLVWRVLVATLSHHLVPPPVSPVSQGSVEIELNGRDQGWEVEGSQVDGSE